MLAGGLAAAMGAPSAIGTIVAKGSFQVDNASVSGNATVFDGSTIETRVASSELRLASGERMLLGAASRGKVHRDYLVLERGASRIEGASDYSIRARGLRIQAAEQGSSAEVALAGAGRVQVAALRGAFRVMNADGLVVANVAAGRALDLEPQAAGAAAPSRLTGCLAKKSGKFLLTDETTSVTAELQGAGLAAEAGNRVEITGAMNPSAKPAAGASQVIKVSEVKRVGKGCGSKVGAAVAGGAAAGAGAGAAGGISAGATAAIVGGVAAAATAGGLAAAGTFSGEESKPSTSR